MRTKAILGLLMLAGCVTVSKTVLTEEFSSAPLPEQQVMVLMASLGDTMSSECVRVAILHASGDQDTTDEGEMISKLREEAGKLGANTLFIQDMEEAGTAERVIGEIFDVEADRDSEAVALYCES